MSDLLDMAKGVMKNFDPETDQATNFEGVPDGTYPAEVHEVTQGETQNGNDFVSIHWKITGDDQNGRLLFVNYYFTDATTEISIKRLIKLLHEYGMELGIDAFETFETLVETLTGMVGYKGSLRQKTNSGGFPNYHIDPLIESDPVKSKK